MKKVKISKSGRKIKLDHEGNLIVPNDPIIPYIIGDGTGPDIWKAAVRVIDASIKKSYNNKKIHWMEIYAGEKANEIYGPNNWLPEETLDLINEYLIAIKGPLTTPVGGGIRSINVALRQKLDLYVCLRPIKWFNNVPSPVKHPDDIDILQAKNSYY